MYISGVVDKTYQWVWQFFWLQAKDFEIAVAFQHVSWVLALLGTVYQTRFANMGLVQCQIVSDNKMPFYIVPIYHALLIDLAKNDSPLKVSQFQYFYLTCFEFFQKTKENSP